MTARRLRKVSSDSGRITAQSSDCMQRDTLSNNRMKRIKKQRTNTLERIRKKRTNTLSNDRTKRINMQSSDYAEKNSACRVASALRGSASRAAGFWGCGIDPTAEDVVLA